MGKRKGPGRAAKNAKRSQRGESALSKLVLGIKGKHAARRMAREERKLDKREAQADKQRKGAPAPETSTDEQNSKLPHSFVFHRGQVGKSVLSLIRDMRKVMQPYTALNLKALKRNSLKDFVVNAAPVGVTHMLVFTRSKQHLNLRIIKLPHGPTLTFRVQEYALSKDILSAQKRPVVYQQQLSTQPLVLMNAFPAQQKHMQLTQSLIQNMFPPIKIDSMDIKNVRRTALLNYNADTDLIDFRHFGIKNVVSGVSKSVKKLLKNKSVPNLAKYEDISQFLLDPGQQSESDVEPCAEEVQLPSELSARGCHEGAKASVRLSELGPRLQLRLLKIEERVCDGEVLYHALLTKTEQEVAAMRKEHVLKRRIKDNREKAHEAELMRQFNQSEGSKQRKREKLRARDKKQRKVRRKEEKKADKEEQDEPQAKRRRLGAPPGKRIDDKQA